MTTKKKIAVVGFVECDPEAAQKPDGGVLAVRRAFAAVTAGCFTVAFAPAAFASSAGMPWESPLQRLVQSLTGPVAKGIGISETRCQRLRFVLIREVGGARLTRVVCDGIAGSCFRSTRLRRSGRGPVDIRALVGGKPALFFLYSPALMVVTL
jgi:hypothetical protein